MWDKRRSGQILLPCRGRCWHARGLLMRMIMMMMSYFHCWCGFDDDWWFALAQRSTEHRGSVLPRLNTELFSHAHSRPLKHFSADKPGWWHRQSVLIQYRWTRPAQYPCVTMATMQSPFDKSWGSGERVAIVPGWERECWAVRESELCCSHISLLFNQCHGIRRWWMMKLRTLSSPERVFLFSGSSGCSDWSRGHWSPGCSDLAAGMVRCIPTPLQLW